MGRDSDCHLGALCGVLRGVGCGARPSRSILDVLADRRASYARHPSPHAHGVPNRQAAQKAYSHPSCPREDTCPHADCHGSADVDARTHPGADVDAHTYPYTATHTPANPRATGDANADRL
jgi:hypothetical protein